MENLVFKLKTLTPIWTGGAGKSDKLLHLTGIKGSLRWWYEVLIRGLKYYACDPTDSPEYKRCELKLSFEEKETEPLTNLVKGKLCAACYLFGCGGWSGKFVFRVTEPASNIVVTSLNGEDKNEIPFDIHFIEKKQFEKGEELLLKMTMRLIVDYGAIGGKTVLKPSEQDYKNILSHQKRNHLDYGIIDRRNEKNGKDESNVPTCKINTNTTIYDYLKDFSKSGLDNHCEWPSLDNFWFVKGAYMHREILNTIVRRDAGKPKKYLQTAGSLNRWIGGNEPKGRDDQAISKKIFSFHGIHPSASVKKGETLSANDSRINLRVRRSFGYAKQGQIDDVVSLIEQHAGSTSVLRGTEVQDDL